MPLFESQLPMTEGNVIVVSSVLTSLILGARQAFYTGIFQLGLAIPRQSNFRGSISRWAGGFFITIAIGTVLTQLLGIRWFHNFSHIEYFITLLLALTSLTGHFSNSSRLTSLLTSNRWPYLLAIVQGIGAFSPLSAIYALALTFHLHY